MLRIAQELLKIAQLISAKKRPDTLFEQEFFDLRAEVKEITNTKGHAIANKVQKALESAMGNKLVSAEAKLGFFRGHPYITSAPVQIKADAKQAKQIEGILKSKFSPKFRLKGVEDGVASFNVR